MELSYWRSTATRAGITDSTRQEPRLSAQTANNHKRFLGDQPGTRWGRQGQPEQRNRLVSARPAQVDTLP